MTQAFSATRDADPYPYYKELHSGSPVIWDSTLRAWLVHDLDLCRFVLQHEAEFNRADRFLEGGPENKGDPRSLALIDGKAHARLHRLYAQLIDDERADALRESAIRPAADELIDAFIDRKSVDLTAAYADLLPLYSGFRVLGLSPEYDVMRPRVRELRLGRWKWNESMGDDAEEARISGESVASLRALFAPIIRAHEQATDDDLICEIWRRGRALFDDWGELDTHSLAQTQLGGETPYLLANVLYLLANDRDLQQRLRESPQLSDDVVEEGLRLVGPVHYQMRVVTKDLVLGSTEMRKGDRVLPMLAAANRDPDAFDEPDAFRLDRPNLKKHVGLGFGPRYCTGASLAKAETREGIQRLLERVQPFALDPAHQAPQLGAFHVRSFRPVTVVFD